MKYIDNQLPFFDPIRIEDCGEGDYSSPSIMTIFEIIVRLTENQKYIVSSQQQIFNILTTHVDGGEISGRKIIINKHLLNGILKYHKVIGKKSINYSPNFKRVGVIVNEQTKTNFELFYTKKVLKHNMSISMVNIEDNQPFDVWYWNNKYHMSRTLLPINHDWVKKCQIKIYP